MKLLHLVFFVVVYSSVAISSHAINNTTIAWQPWNKATFERAVSENKLILLNVGMEGCEACHRMTTITYADPDVIAMINGNFIAIAVDAEARPDIGERYSDWAWPATIFMKPDASQVLALRGNRLPRNFIPILNDLIGKHQAGSLEPDPDSPYAAPPKPVETQLTKIRDRVRAQIDNSLNEENGGWSRNGVRSETAGERLQHLFFRAHMYNSQELQQLALKTSEVIMRGLDPVWGGAYVMVLHEDSKMPASFKRIGGIPEMRISSQINAIAAFAEAYQHSKDKRYQSAALEVDRYLRQWMMAEDGTYYTNQKVAPPELSEGMTGMDYWMIDSDAERRKYGTPPMDHAIYTDKNSEMITAYVQAYEAFGKSAFLETAIRTANALIRTRLQKEGWILQATGNEKVRSDHRGRPYTTETRSFLSAQAWFGSAMLALYRATGDRHWLDRAQAVANQLMALLEDKQSGGFYATTLDSTAGIIPPRKPLEQNATAARFFYDLWVYSKDDSYKDIPERTLRAVAVAEILAREGKVTGQLALALEKITAAYVEFSIVGDPQDDNAIALFNAARSTYHPRKLAHFEKPGRYPDKGKAALYICNPDMCSLPIESPEQVALYVIAFHGPATTN
jgi:uncharacterized protein